MTINVPREVAMQSQTQGIVYHHRDEWRALEAEDRQLATAYRALYQGLEAVLRSAWYPTGDRNVCRYCEGAPFDHRHAQCPVYIAEEALKKVL